MDGAAGRRMRKTARRNMLALLALAAWTAVPGPVLAQENSGASAASPPETEEERRERETRTACAITICSTLHNQRPDAGEAACKVTKTWRKELLTKLLAQAKLTWPWGYARCTTNLKLDRGQLVKAMTEPEFEVNLEKHHVSCEIESEKGNYEIGLDVAPKVTFKQGKATGAKLNWGKIEAPALAKSALWSATAADNAFGFLQTTVVEDVNRFIDARCMEVKEAWQGK
jgi:hypothetical protein